MPGVVQKLARELVAVKGVLGLEPGHADVPNHIVLLVEQAGGGGFGPQFGFFGPRRVQTSGEQRQVQDQNPGQNAVCCSPER